MAEAVTNVPATVKFCVDKSLMPTKLLLASVTNALLAIAVPGVTPVK